MKKTEFMQMLSAQLDRNGIADREDILAEYQQHFAFKLADGFSEEEICAKLGDPKQLAAQFDGAAEKRGSRVFTVIGLGFTDFFAGIFFVLLAAWGVVIAAASVSCAVLAVCLFGGLNLYALIPPMPYWCGAVFGLTLAALAVLAAAGTVYYWAFFRQMLRAFGRFQHNTLAVSAGKAPLPTCPIAPQLAPKQKRRLRLTALCSLALFAACFVLGLVVAMLSAGGFEFWHIWGWFGYAA